MSGADKVPIYRRRKPEVYIPRVRLGTQKKTKGGGGEGRRAVTGSGSGRRPRLVGMRSRWLWCLARHSWLDERLDSLPPRHLAAETGPSHISVCASVHYIHCIHPSVCSDQQHDRLVGPHMSLDSGSTRLGAPGAIHPSCSRYRRLGPFDCWANSSVMINRVRSLPVATRPRATSPAFPASLAVPRSV